MNNDGHRVLADGSQSFSSTRQVVKIDTFMAAAALRRSSGSDVGALKWNTA